MKNLMLMFIVLAIAPTWAITYNSMIDKKCVELSRDGVTWNRTSEYLCIKGRNLESVGRGAIKVVATWEMQNFGAKSRPLAKWNLELISTSKDLTDQHDVYSLSNPENALFNDGFSIRFDVVNNQTQVSIGDKTFFYR